MSRAIHKMRGSRPPVEIIATDLGNVFNSASGARDFTSVSVGASESGKHLIVAISQASDTEGVTISSIAVDPSGDNIAMTEVIELVENDGGDVNRAAIYIADISAISGTTVTIRVTPAGGGIVSWGMSCLTVRNLKSAVQTDSSSGKVVTGTTTTTDATVTGQNGGLAIGAYCNDRRGGISVSWNNLTEKADIESGGGGGDHTHSAAWDLLPTGRSAATETVTNTNGDQGSAIVVAAFR